METKVEALEGNRAKVTITLDAKDVDARIKNTYKEFANKYNFPGFRKGKAPRPIIDNALGKDAVFRRRRSGERLFPHRHRRKGPVPDQQARVR